MSDRGRKRPAHPPAEIPFQQVMAALLDQSKPFNPKYLIYLSDLDQTELIDLEKTWSQAALQRRQSILDDIEELGESDLTLSFEGFCLNAIKDSDPHIREVSARILGEYESDHLVPVFLNILSGDADSQVRAAAAAALGRYIYLGEIEELPQHTLNEIADKLMQVYNSQQAAIVRRRALEALGYSSREEIPSMIEMAYYSNSHDWIVSALFAMGRSLSSQWNPLVMEMLENDDPEILFEAVRAAGELELKLASPLLIELLDHSDSDIRMAAVWSLSQIGGEGVEEALTDLYEDVDDDEEADIIEQALDNLQFTEDREIFAMFDYDEQSDQDDEGEKDIDEIEDEYDPDED